MPCFIRLGFEQSHIGIHLHFEFSFEISWRSPQVPAGATSAIFESAGGKNTYITIAVITIALVIHAVMFLTKLKHPSTAMYDAIARAIIELQNTAIENVITEENTEYDPNLMAKLKVTVKKTLRLIYTVQQQEKGFLHTVSSQLIRAKGENYHIECMLITMLILQNEHELIGIGADDDRLQIDQSELGTIYIEMLLTPGEHNRFSRKVKELLQKDQIQILSQLTQPHDSEPQTSKKKKIYKLKPGQNLSA